MERGSNHVAEQLPDVLLGMDCISYVLLLLQRRHAKQYH